jgi:hypothetical protein
MAQAPQDGGSSVRRPAVRVVALMAVVALLVAGLVVTATAAPGPGTDVKSAQYGAPTTIAKKGPCKGIGGEAGQTCQANAKAQYAKAKAKCNKKHGKARLTCLKAAKKKWVG